MSDERLDEETPISGLGEAGKKKKDALLVLVPESRVSSRSSSDSSLAPDAMDVDQQFSPMRVIRADELMRPQEISVSLPDGEPRFTVRVNWLNDSVSEIERYMARQDTQLFHTPPMAFVRCTRGGKARALLEIAKKLKSKFIRNCAGHRSIINTLAINQ